MDDSVTPQNRNREVTKQNEGKTPASGGGQTPQPPAGAVDSPQYNASGEQVAGGANGARPTDVAAEQSKAQQPDEQAISEIAALKERLALLEEKTKTVDERARLVQIIKQHQANYQKNIDVLSSLYYLFLYLSAFFSAAVVFVLKMDYLENQAIKIDVAAGLAIGAAVMAMLFAGTGYDRKLLKYRTSLNKTARLEVAFTNQKMTFEDAREKLDEIIDDHHKWETGDIN
jgi:hypothetical protein